MTLIFSVDVVREHLQKTARTDLRICPGKHTGSPLQKEVKTKNQYNPHSYILTSVYFALRHPYGLSH